MYKLLIYPCLSFLLMIPPVIWAEQIETPSRFISHIVDAARSDLRFFWRDGGGQPYQSFRQLKQALAEQNLALVFAMNGGIYQKDFSPLGLYIEKGQTQYRISRRQQGYGNFYIQPNGVFYLTSLGEAMIVPTRQFKAMTNIAYATQSGPMLVINGEVNPKLTEGSSSLRIRNGVGILPDGRVIFAISKSFVNFYDFAAYFKQQGCDVALYLDGSVSKIFLPEKSLVSDGRFGVIIGQVEPLVTSKEVF